MGRARHAFNFDSFLGTGLCRSGKPPMERIHPCTNCGMAPMDRSLAISKLVAQLRAGDTLVVWKLDRLSRSLKDLLTILERIDRTGAKFRSLTQPTRLPAAVL